MNSKVFRIISAVITVLLIVSLFFTVEFGLLYLRSLDNTKSDGIPAPGTILEFYFGDDGWTLTRYYEVLSTLSYISFFLFSSLLVFRLFDGKQRR